ncbi:MAG TPA: amidohydrolase family protein [Puia sp.]|nr:amidohydrolase family protein [Puia sp.]
MNYRKFRADKLFDGHAFVPFDAVLIASPDGIVQAVVPAGEAGEGIESYRGVLCPGFVNCHCHLELSHLRGVVPERTGLVDFLSAVIGQRGKFKPAEIAAGILKAEQEMLDNGIVAIGDICNSTDSLERKKGGRLTCYNFIETMGFIERTSPDRFAAAVRVYEAFEKHFPGKNSVVPHAPYSVSPALFQLVAGFAGNRIISMHSQESVAENEFYLTGGGDLLRLYRNLGLDLSFFRGTGRRSLASVMEFFDPAQRMILVHNVDLAEADLGGLRGRPNLYFCLCPNANLYIGGQLPAIEMLVSRGCRMVVGTDSLASNHGLNILAELCTLQEAFPRLATETLLGWATAGGAEALGMDGMLGSFSSGLRPGVLLIEGLAGDRFTASTAPRRLL